MLMHRLLWDAAERRPDHTALRWVDRDRSLTFAETVAATERVAGAFHALGVAPGDRVGIVAHNGLDYLLAMLGAWRLGAITALTNVRFKDELDWYFADHEPKVVVYTHDIHEEVTSAKAAVPTVRHLVCMDGPKPGAHGLGDLMAADLGPPPDPLDERAVAHLSYTSGTTGKPKGACLAHEPTVTAARCIGERLRITGDDVSFGPSALSSSYQLVANLLPPLAVGATVNVMGKWTRPTGFDAIDAIAATFLVANPPILTDLLEESRARGRAPGRLRFGLSGGGPVPPALKRAWRDELELPLVESYGQSELGGFMALGVPELVHDDAAFLPVGRPLPDKEVRIFGPNDERLPPGRVGEVVLRGGFMWGYWGRPDKTAETLRDGWLRSGDLGSMDEAGRITMRGRKAELVTVGGVAWFPRDVEEALMAASGIGEAALVGLPDAALGSRPVAFVTLEAGATLDAGALKAAVAAATPYDPAPLEIRAIGAMPMTVTGKIAKAELREQAARMETRP
jgi:acyl-CoA synthetase (AMP-forming)/AMP-acid ligase II